MTIQYELSNAQEAVNLCNFTKGVLSHLNSQQKVQVQEKFREAALQTIEIQQKERELQAESEPNEDEKSNDEKGKDFELDFPEKYQTKDQATDTTNLVKQDSLSRSFASVHCKQNTQNDQQTQTEVQMSPNYSNPELERAKSQQIEIVEDEEDLASLQELVAEDCKVQRLQTRAVSLFVDDATIDQSSTDSPQHSLALPKQSFNPVVISTKWCNRN